ncbi:MAG: HEPN domain-containing protein [Caldilineaceae bacterium SB0668_bin_21]|nr:HEPN domain-containing protein [Caldilineaceae bacterium SB0668_bin_21]MYC22524.1 HEPN domain-containing protein [Caldilineaceae bacterium SB0662_bin_25]
MNDAELVVQEAQRWLRFAAEDLDAARRLLAARSSAPRHVCWHSQQAAERALKAALVLEGIDFPFTHDLNALRNLLPDSWPVWADLAELTGWAVQARYPGQWPEPSTADAACVMYKVVVVEIWYWWLELTTRSTRCRRR